MAIDSSLFAALSAAAGAVGVKLLDYLMASGRLKQNGLAAERRALAEETAQFRAELRQELDELREENRQQARRIAELELSERQLKREVETLRTELARYREANGS